MEHTGIDLGSSRSSICVMNGEGVVLLERTLHTKELDRFLAKSTPNRVVIESCAESRRVAQLALKHGHEVRVVPTSLVRSLGVGARNIKTDKRDARNLASASFRLGDELPQVHVRSDEAASIQDLVRARESLISQRTAMINFVRAQLRKELLGRGPRCTSKLFTVRVRTVVGEESGLQLNAHLKVIDMLNEQIDHLEMRMKETAKKTEQASTERS